MAEFIRWIPVNSRLPETDGYYIIAKSNFGYVSTRRFNKECPEAFRNACSHWMPMPKPPKK